MKTKQIIPYLVITVILLVGFFCYIGVQKAHTFTLATQGSTTLHSEQIQPLFGTVKVSSDCDTDVVFTDIESGETYTIGYITPGMWEKIKLQNGRWYTIEGAGNLTVSPVNVRIE